MKDIDWKVLAKVTAQVVGFILFLLAISGTVIAGFVYLGEWMLLSLPLFVLVVLIRIAYQEEMRKKRRHERR